MLLSFVEIRMGLDESAGACIFLPVLSIRLYPRGVCVQIYANLAVHPQVIGNNSHVQSHMHQPHDRVHAERPFELRQW
jgi:hypothetical protein